MALQAAWKSACPASQVAAQASATPGGHELIMQFTLRALYWLSAWKTEKCNDNHR